MLRDVKIQRNIYVKIQLLNTGYVHTLCTQQASSLSLEPGSLGACLPCLHQTAVYTKIYVLTHI